MFNFRQLGSPRTMELTKAACGHHVFSSWASKMPSHVGGGNGACELKQDRLERKKNKRHVY